MAKQQWPCTRTHESNSRVADHQFGTITQRIFRAQSGAGPRQAVWKWSAEIRYPAALSLVLENCHRLFFGPDLLLPGLRGWRSGKNNTKESLLRRPSLSHVTLLWHVHYGTWVQRKKKTNQTKSLLFL